MSIHTLLVLLDIAAGIVFIARAFPAIVHMSWATSHLYRVIYLTLGVGAVGMIVSPLMDADWRRYAHVAVLSALALLVLVDRRVQLPLAGAPH